MDLLSEKDHIIYEWWEFCSTFAIFILLSFPCLGAMAKTSWIKPGTQSSHYYRVPDFNGNVSKVSPIKYHNCYQILAVFLQKS